jgi:archaellum biogenesis ATPase FlaH
MDKFTEAEEKKKTEANDIRKKEKTLKLRRINRDYDREMFIEKEMTTVAVDPSLHDDIFASFYAPFKTAYKTQHALQKQVISSAVPFICDEFKSRFHLVPGQLMTIAAYTGSGKSTTTVNAAANYIRHGKCAFIISNEETAKDMFDMVACILLGVSHQDMANCALPPLIEAQIVKKVKDLYDDKLLFVMDGELSNNGTSKAEYILNLLEAWKKARIKPDVVFIDYLTNIYSAGSTQSKDHYFQLDMFLKNLKNLINILSFPVVMCAQMHSDDKKKGTSLDAKLIMGGVIQQVSTIAVEVKVNRNNLTSEFVIHKNRRFKNYEKVVLKYDTGLLRSIRPNDNLLHNIDNIDDEDDQI